MYNKSEKPRDGTVSTFPYQKENLKTVSFDPMVLPDRKLFDTKRNLQ